MGDFIRVYKHGSATYTDITSASTGGYTGFTINRVRNDAGGLEFTLEATTIEMMRGWLDDMAKAELWIDDEKIGTYIVENTAARWRSLSASVSCNGVLVRLKGWLYTGEFLYSATFSDIVGDLLAGTGITLGAIGGTDEVLGPLSYVEVDIFQAISEIAATLGRDFYINSADELVFFTPPSSSFTAVMDEDVYDVEIFYDADSVYNRVVVQSGSKVYPFDDAASQAAYGVRTLTLTAVQGNLPYAIAEQWATAYLNEYSQPKQRMRVIREHDLGVLPGQECTLSDATVADMVGIVRQWSWTLGDLYDAIDLGPAMRSFAEPKFVPPRQPPGFSGAGSGKIPVSDGEGGYTWQDLSGGLVRGKVSAYDAVALTVTFTADTPPVDPEADPSIPVPDPIVYENVTIGEHITLPPDTTASYWMGLR